jgi:hypothetical protein
VLSVPYFYSHITGHDIMKFKDHATTRTKLNN